MEICLCIPFSSHWCLIRIFSFNFSFQVLCIYLYSYFVISSAECYTVKSPFWGHIECDIPRSFCTLETPWIYRWNRNQACSMFIFLPRFYAINSAFMFCVQNGPKLLWNAILFYLHFDQWDGCIWSNSVTWHFGSHSQNVYVLCPKFVMECYIVLSPFRPMRWLHLE